MKPERRGNCPKCGAAAWVGEACHVCGAPEGGLADFLLARIAEDEEQANRSLADHAMNPNLRIPGSWVEGVAARVLAECEAKRRIVEEMADMEPVGSERREQLATLRWVCERLALPYADHPQFQEAWRV